MAPGLNFLEHTYTIYLHRYTVYTYTLYIYIYITLVGLKEYIVIYCRTLHDIIYFIRYLLLYLLLFY